MTRSLAALAAIVDASCGAFVRIPVRVSGAWQPEAALSRGWTRRGWCGEARAAEPLVALLIAGGEDDTIEWHKSERPRREPAGQEADRAAAAGRAGDLDRGVAHGLALGLTVTAGPGRPLVNVTARARGAHASVTARVPVGVRAAALAGSLAVTMDRTVITASTGALLELAAFDVSPRVVFSLLLLAASQVEVGRNGLWRVRRRVAPALHEPLRTMLTRRRHGTVRLAAPH